jgi:DNA-binding NarL/FixJ family response regulator
MSLRTFLVEDSPTILSSLIPTLQELGDARVVSVAGREGDAVAWLQANGGDWDLAVVDMFLQEGSGLGVLRACQNRQTHQRVVVLTNYATEEMRRRCLALGANAVFDKSTELDELFDYCATLNASGIHSREQ